MDRKRHQAFLEMLRRQIISEKHARNAKTSESSDEAEDLTRLLEENFNRLFGASTEA